MAAIGLGLAQDTISTAIPQPYDVGPERFNVEATYLLADGSAGKDIWATRGRWKLAWRGLTPEQIGQIAYYFLQRSTFWFQDFEGNQYEVMASDDKLPISAGIGGTDRAVTISMTVEWIGNLYPDARLGIFTFGMSAFGGGHVFGGTLTSGPFIFGQSVFGGLDTFGG